jgi:predicted NAD/FAD-dependent oxidoreductase
MKATFDLVKDLATLTDAEYKEVMLAAAVFRSKLPVRPALSEEELQKVRRKGAKRSANANGYYKVVKDYPQFLPAYLSMEKLDEIRAINTQMYEIRTKLERELDTTYTVQALTGSVELDAYAIFIKKARQAASEGDNDGKNAVRLHREVNPNAHGEETRARNRKNKGDKPD